MAEKAEKLEKKEPAPAPADAGHAEAKGKAKGGLLTKLPVLLGGVMLIEGAVLFGGFKLFGARPAPADAAMLSTGDSAEGAAGEKGSAKKGKTVEVPVGDYKALNRTNGRTFLYDISIYVETKAENEQKVTDAFKDAKALIEDRIRTIIAESDPDKLGGGSEPGLETLRRQVKYQLDRIVGDGIINEVLIPRCLPFRTD
jgi:flagellar basal body-associated protein FliL